MGWLGGRVPGVSNSFGIAICIKTGLARISLQKVTAVFERQKSIHQKCIDETTTPSSCGHWPGRQKQVILRR
jgi:hypothetical protein